MRISNFRLNAAKKVDQGLSLDMQYKLVNAAREKRRMRRENNRKAMVMGGWAQIPILKICQ